MGSSDERSGEQDAGCPSTSPSLGSVQGVLAELVREANVRLEAAQKFWFQDGGRRNELALQAATDHRNRASDVLEGFCRSRDAAEALAQLRGHCEHAEHWAGQFRAWARWREFQNGYALHVHREARDAYAHAVAAADRLALEEDAAAVPGVVEANHPDHPAPVEDAAAVPGVAETAPAAAAVLEAAADHPGHPEHPAPAEDAADHPALVEAAAAAPAPAAPPASADAHAGVLAPEAASSSSLAPAPEAEAAWAPAQELASTPAPELAPELASSPAAEVVSCRVWGSAVEDLSLGDMPEEPAARAPGAEAASSAPDVASFDAYVDAAAASAGGSAPIGKAMNDAEAEEEDKAKRAEAGEKAKQAAASLEAEGEALEQLEQLGFENRELNRAALGQTGGDMRAAMDALANTASWEPMKQEAAWDLKSTAMWEPMLQELADMGFEDREVNQRMMLKNRGDLKGAVKDLVQFYNYQ